MNGVPQRPYTYEDRQHHGLPVYEWLLDRARTLGMHGGTAFNPPAGYGRHGKLHEQHCFELAGTEPVIVEFADVEQAARLIEVPAAEKLDLFYARLPTAFGMRCQS